MTMTQTDDAFMHAADYGRALPTFPVNLLVRNLVRSLHFYRDVLGVTVRHANNDFAVFQIQGVGFMLHADHTYDRHPLYAR